MSAGRPNSILTDRVRGLLKVFFVLFVLIGLKTWNLAVVKRDTLAERAQRPMKKTNVLHASRGTIEDREQAPLATNTIQYEAAVRYSQIREIPVWRWEIDEHGRKVKQPNRRQYIRSLAVCLASELQLDPDRIEDLIHSKAALYDQMPYTIKRDLSEGEYYRLRAMMGDWPGLEVYSKARRFYPQGKVACDVVGYIGRIDREEYERLARERHEILNLLAQIEHLETPEVDSLKERLEHLEQLCYTMNDTIGKSGVESSFEETLRGCVGKKFSYADARGNRLFDLPGSWEPIPGERVPLSLSLELQKFCEELLVRDEPLRRTRIHKQTSSGAQHVNASEVKEPWIKGGAIVAYDPQNGQVVALASFPRFDPNDFIPSGDSQKDAIKNQQIRRWFELEDFLGEIWEGRQPLERERWNGEKGQVEVERTFLNWESFLEHILISGSPLQRAIDRVKTLEELELILTASERLAELSNGECIHLVNILYTPDGGETQRSYAPAGVKEEIERNLQLSNPTAAIKNPLSPYFSDLKHTYDKLLFLDLCRLTLTPPLHSAPFTPRLRSIRVTDFMRGTQAKCQLIHVVKQMTRELFHSTCFSAWRTENERSFLKEKRRWEKQEGRYARPYLDYLDAEEENQFNVFWDQWGEDLLLLLVTGEVKRQTTEAFILNPFLDHFSLWHRELTEGAHRGLPWVAAYGTLSALIEPLSPDESRQLIGAMRDFRSLTRPLLGNYRTLRHSQGPQTEQDLALAFYPVQGYGYARSQAYRQAATQGSLFKILTAYAALMQRYSSLNIDRPSLHNLNPLIMTDFNHKEGNKWCVGYDADGRPIPLYFKGGVLPRSIAKQLGKLDIVKALEKSSNPYFSLLASEIIGAESLLECSKLWGFGEKTEIALPGEVKGFLPIDLSYNRSGLYSFAIGQHTLIVTPLQSANFLGAIASGGWLFRPSISLREPLPNIKRQLNLPPSVKNVLFKAMEQVADNAGTKGMGYYRTRFKGYSLEPLQRELGRFIGKTSTAECVESVCLDRAQNLETYNHIWFGSIHFDRPNREGVEERYGNPELVVIVYLRFGSYGREAIPIACEVAQKWREIKTQGHGH